MRHVSFARANQDMLQFEKKRHFESIVRLS